MKPEPVKYLTNRALLQEINVCKATFNEYPEPSFIEYDMIVTDLEEVTPEALQSACERKAKAQTPKGQKPPEMSPYGLVVRLMTYDHIPLDPDRKTKPRARNKTHALTSFPPFKHFLIVDDSGKIGFREVGRSHWTGGFANGHFVADKGRMTNRMGKMIVMLVDRYGRRANWRGYSYLEEMKSLSMQHLCQVALQFDESKSSNPFSFYTTTITNIFTRVFNDEKKQQCLRDDLLIAMGGKPSSTKQIEWELERIGMKDLPPIAGRRGRPKTQASQ